MAGMLAFSGDTRCRMSSEIDFDNNDLAGVSLPTLVIAFLFRPYHPKRTLSVTRRVHADKFWPLDPL